MVMSGKCTLNGSVYVKALVLCATYVFCIIVMCHVNYVKQFHY